MIIADKEEIVNKFNNFLMLCLKNCEGYVNKCASDYDSRSAM